MLYHLYLCVFLGLTNLEFLTQYLSTFKGVQLVATIKQLPDTNDTELLIQFFYTFHETHQFSGFNHVILDISTGRKLNQTVEALKSAIGKWRHIHYLIASLVISTLTLRKLKRFVF